MAVVRSGTQAPQDCKRGTFVEEEPWKARRWQALVFNMEMSCVAGREVSQKLLGSIMWVATHVGLDLWRNSLPGSKDAGFSICTRDWKKAETAEDGKRQSSLSA